MRSRSCVDERRIFRLGNDETHARAAFYVSTERDLVAVTDL
jgi:hypothetical protein